MSKVKAPKNKGVPNKHLHARAAFLYQTATYLTLQKTPGDINIEKQSQDDESPITKLSPIAIQLVSDLRQVSRKAQLRLSVDLKRSMCKRCNSVLIPGRTATQVVENPSKGGKKPWADVLLVQCTICRGRKTFPMGPKLQSNKSRQQHKGTKRAALTKSDDAQPSASIPRTESEQSSTTK